MLFYADLGKTLVIQFFVRVIYFCCPVVGNLFDFPDLTASTDCLNFEVDADGVDKIEHCKKTENNAGQFDDI